MPVADVDQGDKNTGITPDDTVRAGRAQLAQRPVVGFDVFRGRGGFTENFYNMDSYLIMRKVVRPSHSHALMLHGRFGCREGQSICAQ